MSVELLIDGYNLLHKAGLARVRYRPGEFDLARDKLLKRLRNSLTEDERARTTIVFDAQYAEREDRLPQHLYGMTILFSPRGRQADDLIEILLAGHPNARNVLVVSSDHRLQRAARSARAASIDSDSFLVELDERPSTLETDREVAEPMSEAQSPSPKSMTVSPGDVEEWMQEFADIDVESITRDVTREMSKKNRSNPSPSTSAVPKNQSPSTGSTGKPSPSVPSHAPGSDPSDPATDDEEDAEHANSSELNFWEQRIAEMLHEEDNQPARDPGKRRRS